MEAFELAKRSKVQEDKLGFGKRQIQEYLNASDCIFVILSPEERVEAVNDKVAELLGHPKEQMLGKNWIDHFVPEHQKDAIRKHFRLTISSEGKGIAGYEGRLLTKDGKEKIIAWQNLLVRNAEGLPAGVMCLGMDITDEKIARDTFEDMDLDFSKMEDSIQDWLLALDPDFKILYMNSPAINRLGAQSKNLIGQSFFDLMPMLKDTIVEKTFGNTIASGVSRRVRYDLDFSGDTLSFDIITYPASYGLSIIALDISEQERIEKALKESEEKFKVISEQSMLGIAIFQDGVAKYINKAARDIIEYDFEELYLFSWKDLHQVIHPDDLSFVTEQLLKKQDGSEDVVTNYTFRMITKNNRKKWVELYSKTIPYLGRTADLVTLIDISERKKFEDALLESEEKYRVFIKNFPGIAFQTQLDGSPTMLRGALGAMLGYSEEEILSGNPSWSEIVYPDDLENLESDIARVKSEADCTLEREYRIRRKDGEFIWVSSIIRNILDKDGNPIMNQGMTFDITDKKKVDESLRIINRALRIISEFNEVMVRAKSLKELAEKLCNILVMTGGYRFVWIGLARRDEEKTIRPIAYSGIEDNFLSDLHFSWSDSSEWNEPVSMAIREGKTIVINELSQDPICSSWGDEAARRGYESAVIIPVIAANGKIRGALSVFSDKLNAFDSEEVDLLSDVCEDLSFGLSSLRAQGERLKAERELRKHVLELSRMNEELNRVAKEASLARGEAATYLDLLCHDIANYTTPVSAYLEMIRNHPDFPDSLSKSALKVFDSLNMIETLISRLRMLTIANQGTESEMVRADLVEALNRAMDSVRAEYENREIEFELVCPIGSATIEADNRINYALESVLGNAVKHDPNDVVNIEVGIGEYREQSRDYWKLTVADHGVGISDEMKERVFRRFGGYWELKRGFGIGLFLSKIIVEYHHGKIFLENRISGDHTKGTKAVILLPKKT